MSKIIKNTTSINNDVKETGVSIPANGQITVDPGNYRLWATAIINAMAENNKLNQDLASGDLVVNDGVYDLAAASGRLHLSYPDTAMSVRFLSEPERSNGFTTKTVQESIEEAKVGYDVDLSRNFYVAKNGIDASANGTLSKPFLTIGACIAHINANHTLSVSNNAVIIVSAGEYTEDTLVLPAYCSILGHHYRTRVSASSGNIDLIQSAGSHTIKGLLLTGVTDASKYLVRVHTTTGKRVTLQDISFSTYEAFGAISNAIFVTSDSGLTSVRLKQVDFGDILGDLVHLNENCRVVIRGAQVFSCPQATLINANNNCSYSIYNVDVDEIYIGTHHKNSEASDISNVDLIGATIPIIKLNSYPLAIRSSIITSTQAQISTLEGTTGHWDDVVEGDTAFRVGNELAVGTSNKGKESVFGEGDSYTMGMKVYTSDGTDTATTEGALTDVTSEAQSYDTAHFGFQGTEAGHCIYVCTDVQNAAIGGTMDFARITGLKINQVVACVEPTEKSIVLESWSGSLWVEGAILATHSSLFHRYGNDTFIRSNSSEHLRAGQSLIIDNNSKKLIAGRERYWLRIRIKNTVTTCPTFNKFKISNNRTEINADGTITMHGLARYLVALSFQSNTFGETGGVTNANFQVGSGPQYPHDNWIHTMKNNQLNGKDDAIYANAIIPEGCCTSSPYRVKVKYIVLNSGTSVDGQLKVSAHLCRTQGVSVANRDGSIPPVPRSVANTDTVSSGLAQVVDVPIDLETSGKPLTAQTASFSVANYYEGDIVFIRVGLNNNGDKKKIAILGIDVEYVKWTLGSRL